MHFTKMLSVCCAIMLGAFFTTETNAQCLTAGFGQWPSGAFTPACNGSAESISTLCYTDEYSQVIVVSGEEYTFSSEIATHLITISADNGATAAASGVGSVTWTATVSDTVRFYTHLSAACDGDSDSFFSRDVTCGEPICPDGNPGDSCDDGDPDTFDDVIGEDCVCAGTPVDCPGLGNIGDSCDDGDPNTLGDTVGEDCVCSGDPITGDCLNEDLFGSADVSTGGSEVITISTCSFQTEHSLITGVTGGETYELTIVEGGYITVRFDSVAGPVVAQGPSPLTFSAPADNDLYAHWNTNGACQTATACVTTTVQCVSCADDCPEGNIGDPCDDGDPNTINDVIGEDCVCAGTPLPDNDTCDDINSLLQCGQSIEGTTEAATSEAVDPSGCGFSYLDSPSLWYAFVGNASQNYLVTLEGGVGFDGVLYVYSGADCESLVEVGCSDTTLSGGTEAVELIAPAAGVYRVLVYDYSGTGDFTLSLSCESSCQQPFPAVDPASLNTTVNPNNVLVEWDAVPAQIGCQIQVRFAGGALLGGTIVGGASASSFNIPGGFLQPGTDYEWRVRCGCSQTPVVAGPFSAWTPFSTPGGAITSQPNPTEGQSNVTFTVLEDSYTTLEVYDMSGRMVDAIFTGNAQANNEYRFQFDGSSLPNGVYIYRLTTENEVVNEKFVIAR